MALAPSALLVLAIVCIGFAHLTPALPLKHLHKLAPTRAHAVLQAAEAVAAVEVGADSQERAWVEAELVDAAADATEADAEVVEAEAEAAGEGSLSSRSGAQVLKTVRVTAAAPAIDVQCQLTVDDANTNTIDAVWLAPLRQCVALKAALNTPDDLPALDATWVTNVIRTNPTNWEVAKSATKTALKVVWNWTAGWRYTNYDYPNGGAPHGGDITAGIKAGDAVEVQFANLAIISGVMNPAPPAPNNVARACIVVPQSTNPTLSDANVAACAAVLRARAGLNVVYAFTYADTSARAPATVVNGAINAAVTITIDEPIVISAVLNPAPANPNHIARPCLVRRRAGLTLSDALVNECAAALPATAALPPIVYTYTYADTSVRNPATALNGAVAAALTLTIDQPAAVDVLKNVVGHAQLTVHTWIRRTLAVTWNAAFVAAVNAHAAMHTIHPDVVGEAAGRNAIAANTGGNAVAWDALNTLDPATLIQVEYWSEITGGTAPNAWFPPILTSAALGAAIPNYPTVGVDTMDNIKVSVVGGASQQVIYINCADEEMTHATPAIQNAARTAAEAALLAAANTAAHLMTPADIYTRLLEGNAAPMNGPSRTLKHALQAASHAHTAVINHFGFGFFVLNIRLMPRTIAHNNVLDRLPTKAIGWLGFAGNLGAGGAQAGGTKGAGVHTEQRIVEQLRRFVNRLEALVPGGTGLTLKVERIRSRWITEFDPDDEYLNNCQWMFKYTRVAATQGFFRTSPYTEVVRPHGDPANTEGAGLWNLAATQNSINGGVVAAADVIAWADPVGHFIYTQWPAAAAIHGQRTQFQRRRQAYLAAGGGLNIPNAGVEQTWGNPDGSGNGIALPANFFALV